ncbi:glucosaminidase domain-containing protein [Macrococcus armenti]|uniref:glucosaminidase domain-containing protein n=1 Tax=Macrococcus armenti TaxID=2875764 RepID=UPI001CD4871C|nr:glucosaminidase domain-containing protein [Macrococcus armenti]UBH11632.1 glucosaminidase domain-containing protein [Macrococcus armenti]
MDNKFYYKTPAALLMMIAGGTTVAHAAEQPDAELDKVNVNATNEKSDSTETKQTTKIPAQEVTSTHQATPIDVKSQYSINNVKTTTSKTAQNHSVTAADQNMSQNTKEDTTVTAPTQTNAATTETKPTQTDTVSAEVKTTQTNTVSTDSKPAQTDMVSADSKPAQTKTVTTAKKMTDVRPTINSTQVRSLAAKTPTNMSVNEYIKYKNYKAPQYETRYFKDAPQIAYRNGVGKPEGIVAHETANPTSTIEGEIAYMSRNINNAFVHAFVDDNNIIETANTDYLSWGAGGVANPRYINVELVRVYGKDRFSKSVNNLADYLATNLLYYNLPVDNAHNDGRGTVWSHKAVSNFLGGTDHTDPVGWFAENNYSFDEFYSLVQEKYNYKLNGTKPTPPVTTQPAPPKPAETVKGTVKTSTAQMMARVNSASAKIYSSVDSVNGVNAGQKSGQSYYVNKKATLNGVTYYALTDNSNVPRGWVKSTDTTAQNRSAETKVTGNFNINSQATNLYNTPWGTANQVVTNLKSHVGKKFIPQKKVTVGKTNYYFGTVSNITGWINFNEPTLNNPKPSPSKPVVTQPIKVSKTQLVANVKLPTSKIYTSVDQKIGKNAGDKSNRTYYVNKKATYNGSTFYALTDESNIPRGWVKANDAVTSKRTPEVKMTGKYKVNSKATSLYSIPNGTVKQVVKQLKPFIGKSFTPSKKMTVNNSVYVYGKLNNIAGWIKQQEISVDRTPVISKSKRVKLIGRTAPKQVLIYKDLKTVKPVTKLIDTQVYVNETATRNNVAYYKVADSKNKVLGWISSKFIKTAPTSTINWTKASYTVKAPKGYIYNIPNGAQKQRIDKLSSVKNGTLQVIRTDKVGKTLWHKVIYNNNKIGYVSSRDLFAQNIKRVKSPTSLSAAVNKQMTLKGGSAPKVVFSTPRSSYNVRNATAAEVKKAMDTKDKLIDPVQKYQFLDLGKAEGISAKTLNKLLVGKGALAGQGAAFAQAAKQFNINEVYLIAHAILETGHGTSRLSNGLAINSTNTAITQKGKKYYNMYGAKAIDTNTEVGGIKYAKSQGWDTQSKAIIGGAKYVRSAYIDQGQRTLHQMRWNPAQPATHQYATDINWASKNAAIIAGMYKTLGLDAVNYVVHEYK